jgi:hypothetical protein
MAWTGTVLDCTTVSEQTFTLTLYASGAMWTADDPHGLLEVTAGTWLPGFDALEQAETVCGFEGREYLTVVADVAVLLPGAVGTGTIHGAEGFQWVCGGTFD